MRNVRKALATALAAGLVAGSLTAPVAEAQTATLNQGDGFTVKKSDGKWSGCTVGYIDPERSIFFTAAHCFGSLDDEVYLLDQRTKIGKPVYFGVQPHPQGDLAVVDYSQAADSLTTDNPYSDSLASNDEIVRGAEICHYGNSTKEVRCGVIDNFERSVAYQPYTVLIRDHDMLSLPGNSGGPVWLKETGHFLGTIVGYEKGLASIGNFHYANVVPRNGQRLFDGSEIVVTETPAPVTTTRTQTVTTTRTVTPAPVTTTRTVTTAADPVTVTTTAAPRTTTVTADPATKTVVSTTTAKPVTVTSTATETVTSDREVAPVTVTKEREVPVTVTKDREVVVSAPAHTVTETVTRDAGAATVTETVTKEPVTVTKEPATVTTTAPTTVVTTVREPVSETVTATVREQFERNPASDTRPKPDDTTGQSSISTGGIVGIVLGILALLGIGAAAFGLQNGALQLPF